MKKFILAIPFFGFGISLFSQITNDGSVFFMQPGSIVYSESYVLNENGGQFDVSGDLYLEGDWINNAGNTALINSSPGTVIMNGGPQFILGTDVTRFYNLQLDGGASLKTMGIDAQTENNLDLLDAQLQTQGNIMYVLNPNVNAISWNTGFVNSNSLGGYLSRATNTIAPYSYPVGGSSLPNTYRAVEITPSTTNNNEYAVRLAVVDASLDNSGTTATGATGPFNRASKLPEIGVINSNYYHNITRLTGSDPASVNVYYFQSDGNFQSMVQWQTTTSRWESTLFTNSNTGATSGFGSPNMVSSLNLIANFAPDVYALNEILRPITIPEFISPNGDNQNDVLDIDNLEYYPNNTLQIFNRWGNLVYEKQPYLNDWNGSINVDKGINKVIGGTGILPSGTYFYLLDLGVDGTPKYTGYVQIRQ